MQHFSMSCPLWFLPSDGHACFNIFSDSNTWADFKALSVDMPVDLLIYSTHFSNSVIILASLAVFCQKGKILQQLFRRLPRQFWNQTLNCWARLLTNAMFQMHCQPTLCHLIPFGVQKACYFLHFPYTHTVIILSTSALLEPRFSPMMNGT